MLKEAFKAETLIVGLTKEGWFYTAGSFWILLQDINATPKEFKAAVIELAGDLPDPGTVFRAGKSGNQMKIEQRELYVLPEAYSLIEEEGLDYRKTGILLDWGLKQPVRLIVSEDGRVGDLIRENLMRVPDPDGIEHGSGETEIIGPAKTPDKRWYIWHNDDTWYMAMPMELPADDESPLHIAQREEAMMVARALGLAKLTDEAVK